ncbi:MAG: hypothetical protein WDW38_005407 [Sanguina aurantia]
MSSGTVGHTSDMQQSERRQHAEAATHASAVVRAVDRRPSGTARMRGTGPASSARKAGHRVGVTPRHDDKGRAWMEQAGCAQGSEPPSAWHARGHPSQAGLPQPSRRIPLTSAATKWHCVTHGCVLHDAAPQAVLRKALVCISLPQDPTGDARVVSAATPPEMVAPPSNLAPRSHEPSCSGLGINDIATRPRASHEHVLR